MSGKRPSLFSNRVKNSLIALLFVGTQVVFPLGISGFFVDHAAAALKCTTDTAGANDVPGQKDLTQMCSDTANLPTSEHITWNWDELGTTGNNTMDACALFDTNGNGNADYSACATTNSTPAVFTGLTIYSCGDSYPDKCLNNTVVASYPTAATNCTISKQATDPFSAGASYPYDTVADCTVYLSEVGGEGVATLIDVCSYPSSQPNSDPSDCVVAQPSSAKLEVVKSLSPANDPGLFDLQIDGTTYATGVGDGGSTGEQIVSASNNHNTHTIAEVANANSPTALSAYTTTIVCKDLHGTGTALTLSNVTLTGTTRQATFTVQTDTDVVCTITNTRQTGTITLVKDVVNDDGGTAGVNDFGLSIGGTSVTSGQTLTLNPGSYAINEAGLTGYSFVSITGTGCPTSLGGNVTLTANQSITCTITNDDIAPQLTVIKHVVNDNGGSKSASDFTMDITGTNVSSSSFPGAESPGTTVTLNAGSYSVDEGTHTGYTKSLSTDCSGTIAIGQTKTCTITNDDIAPQLTVIKDVVNGYGGSAQPGDFTMDVTGTNVSTSSFAGSSQGTTVTLDAGSYSVGESGGPSGYSGSPSTDCSGTIAIGESKTCTITNTQQPGSISGYKYNVDATATSGDGTGTPLADWTIYLLVNGQPITSTTTGADGSYSFTGLDWGSYTLAECLNVSDGCSNWTQIYSPSGVTVNGSQLSSTLNNFGNCENASISGYKFDDQNGNHQWDSGEPGLSGWTITLYDNGGSGSVLNHEVASTTTANDGSYSFTNLPPTDYKVCETGQTGWTQTYPTTNGGCQLVTVSQSGHEYANVNFGNQGRGTITVVKNVDDGFGNVTSDVTDWTWGYTGIYGSGSDIATGSTNSQSVAAGAYTVSENQKDNYHVTASSCSGERGSTLSTSQSITVSPGEDVTCTFTNTRDTGTLRVNKTIVNDAVGGDNDGGLFDLNINGSTKHTTTDQGNGGTTGDVTVVTGSYTVSETAGTGTNLADYSSTWSCDNETSGTGTTIPSFTVGKDDSITCTFTNTRLATLTIVKDANPDSSQSFSFHFGEQQIVNINELLNINNTNDFSLVDDGTGTNNSKQFLQVQPGDYYVTEDAVNGWDLTNIDCGEFEFNTSQDGHTINFSLLSGDNITCTFTNTERGSIHGTKSIVNADGSLVNTTTGVSGVTIDLYEGSSATGTPFATTTTDQNGNYSFTNLVPDTYTVAEVTPTGYTHIFGGGTFTVAPGQNVTDNNTVDFGNFQNGAISGIKFNDANGNAKFDEGETTLSGWTIQLKDSNGNVLATAVTDVNGSYSFSDLTTGNYVACEVQQAGWTQILGGSDNGCYDITLSQSGQQATADFGNRKPQGHVLAASTVLVNTGDSVLPNSVIALGIVAAVTGLAIATRRQNASNK